MAFDPVAYIMDPDRQQIRLGLERIEELLARMGNPERGLKYVHVAGTNGKGSTCSFIDAALREAGYHVGLFTSPHLIDFKERICVDGRQITDEELSDVTLFVKECADELFADRDEYPTEFELMTAVGFEFFARQKCDIVVLEVGLGGRLDSTNVIESPEVCVIVRLGIDHVNMLGSDIVGIAREKAAIIKPGASVVSWPQDDEGAMQAVVDKARECGTEVVCPDFEQLEVGGLDEQMRRQFWYKGVSYKTRLLGSYQPTNAALAIEVLFVLQKRGWKVTSQHIREGIAATSWPARFEVIEAGKGRTTVVIDGGHNTQGAEVLAESLADVFGGKRIVMMMSVLADKDYRTMVGLLAPLASAWVCATPPSYRALSATDLANAIREVESEDVPVEACENYVEAAHRARALAGPDDIICAFGSLYAISSVKEGLDATRPSQ